MRLALKGAMQNDGDFMDVILAHCEEQSLDVSGELFQLALSGIQLPSTITKPILSV
jgi:hypothetical protein